MDILSELTLPETWQAFLTYKTEKQSLSKEEAERIRSLLADGVCACGASLRF